MSRSSFVIMTLSLVMTWSTTACQSTSLETQQIEHTKLDHMLDLPPSLTQDVAKPAPNPLNVEPLESLSSGESAGNYSSFTPTSYYHSPDPVETADDYIPTVFFDFDSWQLSHKGREVLELVAAQLESDGTSSLIIEGHCDVQGSEEYNLVLGDRRAQAIHDYLSHLGIAPDRLLPVSFGETHPVCSENDERCHSMNRRGYLLSLSDNDHGDPAVATP